MDKRSFIKSLFLSVATVGTLNPLKASSASFHYHKGIKPKALRSGDTLGLIAPSGVIDHEDSISVTKELFQAMGFRIQEGKFIRNRYGHLAGSVEERVDDIHRMFANPQIKGIICLRGGSGAARLLDQLDYDLICSNPKIFLGYSDITALEMAIYSKTGLVTFHGPVGTSSWPSYMRKQFNDLLVDNQQLVYQNPVSVGDYLIQRSNRIQTINPGEAEGRLIGGNLAVLSGICGTDYLPDFEGAILFLEDVGEELYRVERMFSQLHLSGVLSKLRGFIFGKCTNCKPGIGYGSLTLEQILEDYIRPLDIPAYTGALIGHISEQFLLPIGARVQMNANAGTIRLAERALS